MNILGSISIRESRISRALGGSSQLVLVLAKNPSVYGLKSGSRLKIPANCSFDFTKFYPSIKEKEFEEMNPTHPAVTVGRLQPLRVFRNAR